MVALKNRIAAIVNASGMMWLLKGSAFIFAIQIIGQLCGFANQFLLARFIGPTELGYYVYAANIVMLFATLSALGYQAGGIRFIIQGTSRSDPAYVRGYVKLGVMIGLVGSLLLAGGGILFWWLSDRPTDTALGHPAFPIALCLLPVLALGAQYGTAARALKLFAVSFLPNALVRPAGILLFTLVMIVLGWKFSATTLIIAFCVIMVAVSAWQITYIYRYIAKNFSARERTYESRLWVVTGLQLLLLGLAEGQLGRINVFMSGIYLTPADVAILNICFTYVSPINLGLFSLNSVMAPNASRLYADGKMDELQRLIAHVCHMRIWPCLLAVLILIFAGPWLLLIFGPEFQSGYTALVLIAASRMIVAVAGPQNHIVAFMGLQREAMFVFICALAILIGLNSIFMPAYGVAGAGMAVLGMTVFWNVALHIVIQTKSGIVPSALSWLKVGIWPPTTQVQGNDESAP